MLDSLSKTLDSLPKMLGGINNQSENITKNAKDSLIPNMVPDIETSLSKMLGNVNNQSENITKNAKDGLMVNTLSKLVNNVDKINSQPEVLKNGVIGSVEHLLNEVKMDTISKGIVAQNMVGKDISATLTKLDPKSRYESIDKNLLVNDFTTIGLSALSGLENMNNTILSGVDSAVALGINSINTAKEIGAFENDVIYKDTSTSKYSKSDMEQFIDQVVMERTTSGSNSIGANNTIQHSGVIIIKSDDGKVVTWDQMYGARDLIGSRMASINESYEKGFGNYQNPYKSPIQPLL
jgi:hypothetical protein